MIQTNKISLKWQKVHVFISSTFNDMHAERDYLVKQIFPQLQEWCEKRKLRLVDIDLRWGVTEHDALNNKNVLKVCLDRIDECRPFFLCFLGQRRGWVPKIEEISQETFDSFPELKLRSFAGTNSVTEMEIMHALTNPMHQSRERDPKRSAEYYERVKHAFFYLREPSYLSQLPADPPLLRQTYTNEGVDNLKERQVHEQELNRWRDDKIKNSGPPVHSYQAKWDSSDNAFSPELSIPLQCPSSQKLNIDRWRDQWAKAGVVVRGINVVEDKIEEKKAREFNKKLCSGRLTDFKCDGMPLSLVILKELKEAIAARYPDHIEVADETDLQKEIDQQEQFLFLSNEGFIERGDDFVELDKYVEGDSNKLFVLTAPGGMGKSMLLANWIDRYSTRIEGRKDESIHFRFIGASDRSTTVYSLLGFLLHEMKEITHKFDEEIPKDPEKLREAWPKLLEAIGKRGKTVIVIDALNQLESGLSDLNWLMWQLPQNIKLIVSFKRGEQAAEEIFERYSNSGQVILSEVKPFENLEDRRELVRAYLSQYLKDLDERHLETVIQSPGANNPLYLKVVLSELRVFGAYANLADKIKDDFGETPVSAFRGVLNRLENDPAYSLIEPKKAVPLLFGLMAHARHGLSADELTSLFIQALKLEDTEKQREIASDTVHLFLRQVRPFLARREGRYDFYFESFKNAAEEQYVAKSSEDKDSKRFSKDWHRMLAEYFGSLSTWQETSSSLKDEKLTERRPTIRKVAELPFHQAWAGMDELVDTLTDFNFMEAKLQALEVYSLIDDYDLVHIPGVGEKVKLSEKSLGLIQDALRRDVHFIARHSKNYPQALFQSIWNSCWWHDFSEGTESTFGDDGTHPPATLNEDKRKSELSRLLSSWRIAKAQSLTVWIRSLRPPPSWGTSCNLVLIGHTMPVTAVYFSADGQTVFSFGDDKTVRKWDVRTGREIAEVEIRCQTKKAFAVTSDGRFVLAGNDSIVEFWDLETRSCVRTLEGHRKCVLAVSITPDDQVAVTGDAEGVLRFWNLRTGECLAEISAHSGSIDALSLSPDGCIAASGGACECRLWDIANASEIREVTGFQWIDGVAITSDHKRLAVGGSYQPYQSPRDHGVLGVWSMETGQPLWRMPDNRPQIKTLAITPDGRSVLTGNEFGTIEVWDMESGIVREHFKHGNQINSVAVSRDGMFAVAGSDDGSVRVWKLGLGQKGEFERLWIPAVQSIVITPDSRVAITASSLEVRLWNIRAAHFLRVITNISPKNAPLAVTPDGRHILSKREDLDTRGNEHLWVWDCNSGEPLLKIPSEYCPDFVVVTPNGGYAITNHGACYPPLVMWDLQNGKRIKEFRGHEGDVTSLAMSPNGQHILSGSSDGRIRIWDFQSGQFLGNLEGHGSGVQTLAFAPDGAVLASSSQDGTIRVWDLVNRCCKRIFPGYRCWTLALAILPDCRWLVSGGEKEIRILSLASGKEEASYLALENIVSCAVSPCGSRLVAGDVASNIYILELEHLSVGPLYVTAWCLPFDKNLAFGCPLCNTWSEIPPSALGTEIPCPHCSKPIKLNSFTINADWRKVAKAWGMKDVPGGK